MTVGTLRDLQPEEQLLEVGDAQGIAVRLHRLGCFQFVLLAVLQKDSSVIVTRRELDVGPRGVLSFKSEAQFRCSQAFPQRLLRDLRRLATRTIVSFCAEGIMEGVSLACRRRWADGQLYQIHLFCWWEAEEASVRRVGDYLQTLALSSIGRLRCRAFFSRFW
jgi:hypothetical protein